MKVLCIIVRKGEKCSPVAFQPNDKTGKLLNTWVQKSKVYVNKGILLIYSTCLCPNDAFKVLQSIL